MLKRWKKQLGRKGEGDLIVARDLWSVEEKKFVHDVCGESGAIERWSRFQQDVENFAAAEFRNDRGQINTTVFVFCADDFGASVLQFARLR